MALRDTDQSRGEIPHEPEKNGETPDTSFDLTLEAGAGIGWGGAKHTCEDVDECQRQVNISLGCA